MMLPLVAAMSIALGAFALAQQAPAATRLGAPARPPVVPAAAAGQAQPQLLGQFGDWGAYAATPGGRKVCFALAKPSSAQTSPPNRPRNPMYFFVTTRPAENVRNEVSTLVGYPLKPNSDATAEVGGNSFVMYTQNDGAWIKNVAEEVRMIEAMRKSPDMVIKGISARGTQSTDTYSLKGLSQALDRMAQDCR
jgi:invasion protein IalB